MRFPVSSIPASAAALLLAAAAQAATFTVTRLDDPAPGACDADCSLREAVIAANATPAADTILIPAGTYALSRAGRDEDAAATGDLDVDAPLTLLGQGPRDQVILDGGGIDRVLHVGPTKTGVAATLAHLTIRGGEAAGGTAEIGGGVLTERNAIVAISDCAISGNHARFGGGLSTAGPLTMTDSAVLGNSASGASAGAGGLNVGCGTGPVTIRRSRIEGNMLGAPANFAAGIANCGTLLLEESSLSGNDAGGQSTGAMLNNGFATLRNVTVSGNAASMRSAFSNNGTLNLVNVTLAGNVNRNTPGTINTGGSAATSVANTILQDADCTGKALSSGGRNLENGNDCGLGDPTDKVNIDAKLGPLADNGGPTRTHALLAGSPALNGAAGGNCPVADQRGRLRADGQCDVGAYEEIASACGVNAAEIAGDLAAVVTTPSTVPVGGIVYCLRGFAGL